MDSATVANLAEALTRIFDPTTPSDTRRLLEQWCTELAPAACQHAARLLSEDERAKNDPNLWWYLINSFKQQRMARFWRLADIERFQLLKDAMAMPHQHITAGPLLARQVCALQVTVICHAASLQMPEAIQEMIQIAMRTAIEPRDAMRLQGAHSLADGAGLVCPMSHGP